MESQGENAPDSPCQLSGVERSHMTTELTFMGSRGVVGWGRCPAFFACLPVGSGTPLALPAKSVGATCRNEKVMEKAVSTQNLVSRFWSFQNSNRSRIELPFIHQHRHRRFRLQIPIEPGTRLRVLPV